MRKPVALAVILTSFALFVGGITAWCFPASWMGLF